MSEAAPARSSPARLGRALPFAPSAARAPPLPGIVDGATFLQGASPGERTMTDRQLRVVVVDDHSVFAESLAVALAARGIEVAAVAVNGSDGIRAARAEQPDVVLADFVVPDIGGVDLVTGLRGAAPSAAVVVLTSVTDPRVAVSAFEAGAHGFVRKAQRLDEIVNAVVAAADGETVVSPDAIASVVAHVRGDGRDTLPLSAREIEVLDLAAAGHDNASIAEALSISRNTVRNHLRSISTKLGAHSKLEAVAIGTRLGLVAPGGSATA